MNIRVLAVDDEINNLKIIQGFLGVNDYEVITAEDGVQAWNILEKQHDEIDVILTDRMMPNMDGMELTHKVKQDKRMRRIPVIMQTAAAQKEQVAEGVKAGVYYYLTKPFSPEVLVSIVSSAFSQAKEQDELISEVVKHKKILSLVDKCEFSFNRIEEAHDLTVYLANFYPDPERVTLGISEMLINAIEHGTLGITYEEKSRLNSEGKWEEEIKRRQEDVANANKKVNVFYKKNDKEVTLTIKDEGNGFNWQDYMEIDFNRATDSHGRGIAMSNIMSFDRIEYIGCGNEVCCKISLE